MVIATGARLSCLVAFSPANPAPTMTTRCVNQATGVGPRPAHDKPDR